MCHIMSNRTLGYHAIIEHVGMISFMNVDELELLLRKAAVAANAKVLGANFHDFGAGLGNTGVLLLAESHISIHTWPENNYAAIDVFVCSDSDSLEKAISVLVDADKEGSFDYQIIERRVKENNVLLNNNMVKGAEERFSKV